MSTIPFLPLQSLNNPALIDDKGQLLSYDSLRCEAFRWATRLTQEKSLVFCYIRNTSDSVAAFLGSLAAGHAVALLDPNLPALSRSLLEERYRPDIIIEGSELLRHVCSTGLLYPELALLLSTSGSTGDAKFVRLTLKNLTSNAEAIAEALDIKNDDIAAGHLPLHYSYGLSVLTSHLVKGAQIKLTERSIVDRGFWDALKAAGVTHFPGVPFHYDMILRLGLQRLGLNNLRTMTQAGGHLPLTLRQKVYAFMEEKRGRFYVMYGQTEAAPRISTLPHTEFPDNFGTVGKALRGGRLRILDEEGREAKTGEEGAVWYEGPNVMLGYANKRADLTLGDEQGHQLATGDIGWLDDDGRLTITGRAKRFGKVFGLRINLDDVEQRAKSVWSEVAVVQKGEKIRIYLAGSTNLAPADDMKALFSKHYTLPFSAFGFHLIEKIPYTDRGKIDYKKLEGFE